MAGKIIEVGDLVCAGPNGEPPRWQVLSRDGEWVTIQRYHKRTLVGRVMRRKVRLLKNGRETIRIPVLSEPNLGALV